MEMEKTGKGEADMVPFIFLAQIDANDEYSVHYRATEVQLIH